MGEVGGVGRGGRGDEGIYVLSTSFAQAPTDRRAQSSTPECTTFQAHQFAVFCPFCAVHALKNSGSLISIMIARYTDHRQNLSAMFQDMLLPWCNHPSPSSRCHMCCTQPQWPEDPMLFQFL